MHDAVCVLRAEAAAQRAPCVAAHHAAYFRLRSGLHNFVRLPELTFLKGTRRAELPWVRMQMLAADSTVLNLS